MKNVKHSCTVDNFCLHFLVLLDIFSAWTPEGTPRVEAIWPLPCPLGQKVCTLSILIIMIKNTTSVPEIHAIVLIQY